MRHALKIVLVLCASWLCACAVNTQAKPVAVEQVQQNRVIVLGMIHGRHETSTRYSTDRVTRIIQAIAPDYVLAEIPPDRMAAALNGFEHTGEITEPRVARFPEYVGALFPLTRTMDFEIIPTAGWTRAMAEFRRKALQSISEDPTRAQDWQTYQDASDEMTAKIGDRGDDPYFIHSDEYDAITKTGLTPYAQLFANDLGIGDWETINAAHYANIEAALDAHSGEGATVLITYGAGHKYWFLEHLRQRTDITLVSPRAYFDKVPAFP